MARFLKMACKMSRRVGIDLGLKSVIGRDISTKCNLKVFPGQHGNKRKKASGSHALQLNAKQTIKYFYGVLEKQFKHLFLRVSGKKGASGEFLLKMLESRLDNVVYRSGFATTRAEARQLVVHKSISVVRNDIERIIVFPSYIIKSGDIIKIVDKCKNQIRIQYALKCAEKNGFVTWLDVDVKSMISIFLRSPERKELSNDLNEQLVVEFYSK